MKRISKPPGKTASCVFFFGTDNLYESEPVEVISLFHTIFFLCSAWIEDFNIKPYHEFKDQFTKACKSRAFIEACQAIEQYITNPPVSEVGSCCSEQCLLCYLSVLLERRRSCSADDRKK